MEWFSPVRLNRVGQLAKCYLRECLRVMLGLAVSLTLFLLRPYFHWMKEWMLYLLLAIPVMYGLAAVAVPYITYALLEPQQIRILRFGRTIQSIAVSEIKGIFLTGDHNESVLCVSAYSIEELVDFAERMLSRSWVTRHEVSLRKKYSGWQDKFAGEYLNKQSRRILWRSPDRKLLWLPMNQTNVAVLYSMYPQIQFRNYEAPLDPVLNPQTVPSVVHGPLYEADPQPEGIWLHHRGKALHCLPAESIRTLVRVDHVNSYEKFDKHHGIYIVACTQNVDDLSLFCGSMPFGIEQLPLERHIKAADACLRMTIRWSPAHTGFCPMYYSPAKEALLRQLYPHAEWVDTSSPWMSNRDV